jgi:peptidoglycan hydrolase-like protein with peptidoglycan-binding domain
MSSKIYTNHQRIHQYKNGDSVSYGGHKLTIDWDYLDVKETATSTPANETRSQRVARLSKGSTPTLKVHAKGSSVTRVQRALYATGRKVPVTGYYGYLTVRAVKSYRKANGLRVIPAVTDQMWEALQHGKIK